jgi:glucosamine--fructose-6-phosphate aminotransferase (isomerizing)
MALHDEIFQQPSVLTGLLGSQWDRVTGSAEAIRRRDPRYVFLAARGTSDHAGLYAKYLLGSENQLPIALAATSLFSVYKKVPNLRDALVVGISQSGQSPDILSVIDEGRRQGCPTLAIVNDSSSPMARSAEHVIDISAGIEASVAATKTYTAQLMAVAMLSVALSGDVSRCADLAAVPRRVMEVLRLDGAIKLAVERYRDMTQCAVLGRGFNFATAFEWSLKLKELAYVVAAPYSSADFQHGPIAIVNPGFPVLAIAPKDAVLPDLLKVLERLREECGADLVVISDDAEALALAHTPIRIPEGPAWTSPMVAIVAAQLFCYHLTRAKGIDPEAPRGLRKVTKTS